MEERSATPVQDFLEKYAADGLKRELDLEEAVWRVVPLFVTALGLMAALLGYLISHLGLFWTNSLDAACFVLLVPGVGSTVLAYWNLRFALKSRRHRYPADEVTVCAWTVERRQYYASHGENGPTSEGKLLSDLREFVLSEISQSASNNHLANAEKLVARTKATKWLFLAALFTLSAGGVSALRDSPLWKTLTHDRPACTSPAATSTATATAPSPALGRERGCDPTQNKLKAEAATRNGCRLCVG